jgi:hypothetical protein
MKLVSTIFVALSLLFASYAVVNHKTRQPVKKFDYAASWKKVQEFEDQGLPESALTIVREIYARATDEKDAQQLVKAVIFKMKYTDYKEEDSFIKNLNSL